LPAKSELGDVSEAESTDDISEQIDVGVIEISIHHCALSPIDQFRLAHFAMEIVRDLLGGDLAADSHWVAATLQLFVSQIDGKFLVRCDEAAGSVVNFLREPDGPFFESTSLM
jgi:hypothetical protein